MALWFNYAQTWYLDKSFVQNAAEVALTRIDLYFRALPPPTNNKSGIENPGVELKVVPCVGSPVVSQMGAYRPTEPTEHGAKFAFYSGGQTARVEYDQIAASGSSLVPTIFLFTNPIFVATNQTYAFIIKFDGNDNFVLWTNVIGEPLVGSGVTSTGPTSGLQGALYTYIGDPNASPTGVISTAQYGGSNTTIDPALANSSALIHTAGVSVDTGQDVAYLTSNWSPIIGTVLKFDVHVARYFKNGVPVSTLPEYFSNVQLTTAFNRPVLSPAVGLDNLSVLSNNVLQLVAPVQTTEYVLYSRENTTKGDLVYGEPFYQDGPAYPGGTTVLDVVCAPPIATQNSIYTSLIVQANGLYQYPGGNTFNSIGGWNNLAYQGKLIIIKNQDGTVFLRTVDQIISNTQIMVDQPFDTTMTNCNILVPPIGYLYTVAKTNAFGSTDDLFMLYNSVVSADTRFTGNSMFSANISSGGTGYSNSDYIKISGFEDINFSVKGNYAAFANVVTNGAGVITNVNFSNTGAGFNNTDWLTGTNVQFLQSYANGVTTTNPSTGTGASIGWNVGSWIRSTFANTSFANCEIVNIEVHRMKPEITVNNPLGTSFTITDETLYYSVPDSNTIGGTAYYVDTADQQDATNTLSKIFKTHDLGLPGPGLCPMLPSRSNEYIIRFANGAPNNSNTMGRAYSNSSVFLFNISSNSDFEAVFFDPEIILSHYAKYIINDDYTNEHTNHGSAFARGIEKKVPLTTKIAAEDALVFLDCYRPAGTDLKVYLRMQNSTDQDSFDESDWTLLEQTGGVGLFSSASDPTDVVELSYGLPAYPNTDFTLDGSVTLTQGNVHIVGNTTIFGPRMIIGAAGTGYANGDIVSFTAPIELTDDALNGIFAYRASVNATANVHTNGSGGITSLTLLDVGFGWDSQANVTDFTVANSTGFVSPGTGAALGFMPGLQHNDLIKIYSPFSAFANTNYTIAVVDTINANNDLSVVTSFGVLSANLPGTVSITTASNTLVGTSTLFDLQFSVGDFIAIWANNSTYETHKIVTITDNLNLQLATNGTFINTAAQYARVTADTFLNTSTSVDQLLIDRLAYPHQVFNNIQNDNVARYYNSSMIEFDAYDNLQLKICLMSNSTTIVPKIDTLRGIAVSA